MSASAWLRTATGLLLLASALTLPAHPYGLLFGAGGFAALLWFRRSPDSATPPGLPPWRPALGLLGWALLLGSLWLLWRHCGELSAVPAGFWVGFGPGLALAALGSWLCIRAWPSGSDASKAQEPRALPNGLLFWATCLVGSAALARLPWPLALGLAGLPVLLPLVRPWPALVEPPSQSRSHGPACALMLLLGLALRLWDLGSIPQGINYEEAATLELANPVILGTQPSFFNVSAKFTGPLYYQHFMGAVYHWTGWRGPLPLRLGMVMGWLVLACYTALFCARFFSWRTALGATAFLSLAFFPLHYSRFGFNFIWAPAVAMGALCHALLALRGRHATAHWLAAAAWAALAHYGFIAGWTTPALVTLALLGIGRDPKAWAGRSSALLSGALLFLALSALGIQALRQFPAPLSDLSSGSSGSIFAAGIPPEHNLSSNLLTHLEEIFRTGTQSGMHYLPGKPYLPAAMAVPVLAGLGMLLGQPLRLAGTAVLGLLLLGLLPAWLSNPVGRNTGRLIMLLPPLAILFGLGWAGLVTLARERLPKLRAAAGLTGLLGLLTLVPEPVHYFRDYRNDPKAILANGGPWMQVIRTVQEMRKSDEPVFFSSKFTDALMMTSKFPRSTVKPVRGIPDLLGLHQRYPNGIVVAGPLTQDWLPWLEEQGVRFEQRRVGHPLAHAATLEEGMPDLLGLGNSLAVILRWERAMEAPLEQGGDGAWRGYLWVPRPGAYTLGNDQGVLRLPGGIILGRGEKRRLFLQPVPYAVTVTVTESLSAPSPTLHDPALERRRGWERPFWHRLKVEGLRQTLNSIDHPSARPWISLRPSLSQVFAIWNFEPDISPLPSFPFRGAWEGSLTAPEQGDYSLKLMNNFTGRATIDLDGKRVFESEDGGHRSYQSLRLAAGKPVPIVIRAEAIQPNSQMRLVYARPGGLEAVPASWLRPADLPPPEAEP